MRPELDNLDKIEFKMMDGSCSNASPIMTKRENEPCCGGPMAPPSTEKPNASLPYVTGELTHRKRKVPLISAKPTFADSLGTFKARFGVNRMDYTVPPGLYGIGNPNENSEVLVTANYKMSFDVLRSNLGGLDAWILVLDTRGVNVWCAAGKGTFGTDELLSRIRDCDIKGLVDHRRIILPQLGAPGVAGFRIKKETGFKTIYGPVEARDLRTFLNTDYKATKDMRRKHFPLRERIALIPIELVAASKIIIPLAVVFFFLSGILGRGAFAANLETSGLFAALALVASLIGGSILFPILLPILPGKSFTVKSLPIGAALSALLITWHGTSFDNVPAIMETASWSAIIIAFTAYMAMNFTGASTYTSLSGVQKEMRIALPAQIAAAFFGLVAWVGSRIALYWG